jgi:hypothetical protein
VTGRPRCVVGVLIVSARSDALVWFRGLFGCLVRPAGPLWRRLLGDECPLFYGAAKHWTVSLLRCVAMAVPDAGHAFGGHATDTYAAMPGWCVYLVLVSRFCSSLIGASAHTGGHRTVFCCKTVWTWLGGAALSGECCSFPHCVFAWLAGVSHLQTTMLQHTGWAERVADQSCLLRPELPPSSGGSYHKHPSSNH